MYGYNPETIYGTMPGLPGGYDYQTVCLDWKDSPDAAHFNQRIDNALSFGHHLGYEMYEQFGTGHGVTMRFRRQIV